VVMEQGQDRRRGIAAGADPTVLDARSGRAPLPARGGTRTDGEADKRLARRLEALPDRLLLYTDDGDATAARIHQLGLEPESVLVRRSTLEDVFLHLTGRTLVDE